MYHSKNLYIRRADFDREPLKSEIKRLCDKTGHSTLNARDLAKDLLVGFYFRAVRKEDDQDEQDRSENYAFEFMHNSLFEYLVAEYIWGYFKFGLTDKNSRTQQFIKPFETAFVDLFNLFSPRQLSREVVMNIRALIELESIQEKELLPLFERLRRELFPKMLRYDFLTEYRFDQSNQEQSPIDLSLAVFYGMITVMEAISYKLSSSISSKAYPISIDELRNLEISNFVPFKQVKRFTNLILVLRRNNDLLPIGLSGQLLAEANFDGANLNKINFHKSYLSFASLVGANLDSSNLFEANLKGAKLCGANLNSAFLSGANLSGANLYEADFSGADLHNADLSGANLCRAKLNYCILSGANLSGADLSDAILDSADLNGSDLSGSTLCKTDLSGTDLRDAILRYSNLDKANLCGSSLYGASLRGAKNLDSINNLTLAEHLDQADFTDTIFEGKIHKNPDGSFEIEGYESP